MTNRKEGVLSSAAMAFEQELQRYAELNAELGRGGLHTEKALTRAKKALNETAESQLRLATHLKGLVAAIEAARTEQQSLMEETLEKARHIQTRLEQFSGLMERFAALGRRAREVNEPVAAVVAKKAEGAPAEELLAGLRDVLARTESIAGEAESLAKDATAAEWSDIAREADALKQQVLSARNRLLLATRSVAGQAPS